MPNNNILRCYNLFPSHIGSLTEKLPHIAQMGFNAVWVNPIQLSYAPAMSKADMDTGVDVRLAYSIYAMSDHTQIDPRFSVVTKNAEGLIEELSPDQKESLIQSGLDCTHIPASKALIKQMRSILAMHKDIIELNVGIEEKKEQVLAAQAEHGQDTTSERRKKKLQELIQKLDKEIEQDGLAINEYHFHIRKNERILCTRQNFN